MWTTFPKKHAYELHDYVVKKEYMRAYLKLKECYKILHDTAPDKFDESNLDKALNDINYALNNFLYKDEEFKEVYDAFVQWCDDANLIIPSKLF